jgi:hypothetical protein
MAVINVLELIRRGSLTNEQKNHLRQKLREKRNNLRRAIENCERALEALGGRAKRKKTAKRRRSKR